MDASGKSRETRAAAVVAHTHTHVDAGDETAKVSAAGDQNHHTKDAFLQRLSQRNEGRLRAARGVHPRIAFLDAFLYLSFYLL